MRSERNAAGNIPAWAAGLVQPLAGHCSGGPYPDPCRDDKPLSTISATNVEQYRKQLSAGQIALLQKLPTWQMNEDSWMIAVTDKHETRGELWRVAGQHSINCYDLPMLCGTVEVHTDLRLGRYLAMGRH